MRSSDDIHFKHIAAQKLVSLLQQVIDRHGPTVDISAQARANTGNLVIWNSSLTEFVGYIDLADEEVVWWNVDSGSEEGS